MQEPTQDIVQDPKQKNKQENKQESKDDNLFTANWHYPTDIRMGIGRVKELALICQELKINRPLLVTDPSLAILPMVQHILNDCIVHKLDCRMFSAIKSNPTGENITAGVEAFNDGKHDGVIAVGGGSALDAGKAIALMSGQELSGQKTAGKKLSLWDFEDVGDNWQQVNSKAMAPVIAVPTTAGTGSEVGRASVITDVEQQIKRIIFHPKMMPNVVMLDPQLTCALPPHLTAATGMDALSHALEAYCAPSYHPMAAGIAIEAIRLVKEYLPTAYQQGGNLTARAQMMVASTMGATAFQRGLGAMHALAHPLGAVYDSHHGLLNAILMPYVLVANRQAIEPRIEKLSYYLALPDKSFSGFINWVIALRSELNIPHSLAEIDICEGEGIDAGNVEQIATMAAQDPSASSNPIIFNAQQYAHILRSAIRGEL